MAKLSRNIVIVSAAMLFPALRGADKLTPESLRGAALQEAVAEPGD